MTLTIQTNLNGCLVYMYNSNLDLIPVVVKSTSYLGSDSAQTNITKRRYIVKAAPWETVKNFYLGRRIHSGNELVEITAENADSVLSSYLGYNDALVNKATVPINWNAGWTSVTWTLQKEIDFGVFTVINSPTDVNKFIFNEVVRDASGAILTVIDAEATLLRIKSMYSVNDWISIFPMKQYEYAEAEAKLTADLLSHLNLAASRYDTLMNYYLHTVEYGEADEYFTSLAINKAKIESVITELTTIE